MRFAQTTAALAHATARTRGIALVAALSLACAVHAGDAGDDYESTVTYAPPMFGIEMSPVPNGVQDRNGLTPDQGVYVQNTFGNTAASSMGVRPGDVVLQMNGSPITSMTDLRNEVGLNNVGDPVQVVIVRDGQQLVMTAPLQEWPKNIPKDRIDPEAEKRFRDWQKERNAQSRNQINELQDQLADLDRQLPAERDAAAQARAAALDAALRAGEMPWTLRFSLAGGESAPVIGAAPTEPAPAVTSDGLAWTFHRSIP
ncbi:MAG: PDZ domain-containing protein [Planctomycetes bacterium]|nr:PDZ domain-containing protein [Planctomycetota bacterium]